MEQMRVEGYMMAQRGDARPLAENWLNRICAAVDPQGRFTDPALEAEYQEWKRRKEAAAHAGIS